MHISTALSAVLCASQAAAAMVPNWKDFPLEDISKWQKPLPSKPPPRPVNVTLYAMSRCPDARMCENVFEEVLKAEGIKEKIHLTIDYLGKVDKEAAYGVDCMHGDIECAGNAHQLCLQNHLDLSKFYAALTCMNYGSFPGVIGSTALTRKCAETAGANWWKSGVGRCIQGQTAEREGLAAQRQAAKEKKGSEIYPREFDTDDEDASLEDLAHEARRLLRQSVRRTIKNEVTKSCTIDISIGSAAKDRSRCIVDRGAWVGCEEGHTPADFVRVIEREWKDLNGEA